MSDVQRDPSATETRKPSEIAESLKAGIERAHEEISKEVPRSLSGAMAMGGPPGGLSPTGQAAMEDVEKITRHAQQIVEEKLQPAAAEAEKKSKKHDHRRCSFKLCLCSRGFDW